MILLDCLQRFVEVENLDETEWYTCNNCNKRQPSTKKFWILQLPNVSFVDNHQRPEASKHLQLTELNILSIHKNCYLLTK